MVKQTIVPRVKLLAETSKTQVTKVPQVRFDQNEGQDLENLVDVVEAQFLGRFSRRFIRSNLQRFFSELDLEADQETLGEFARQNITVVPGADTRATIENAINTSTGKIEDLTRTTIGNVRSILAEGVVTGTRWEDIASDLERSLTAPVNGKPTTFKKAANRARFIARNEVGTALGAVNKERQQSAGVELFEWQTSEDERVRATHNSLNGGIFTWDGTTKTIDGVTYGPAIDPQFSSSPTIPGQPWNCRCVAIPFIPELE